MSAFGILAGATLIVAIIAMNQWYNRRRKKLTLKEKQQEDAEMEIERNIW